MHHYLCGNEIFGIIVFLKQKLCMGQGFVLGCIGGFSRLDHPQDGHRVLLFLGGHIADVVGHAKRRFGTIHAEQYPRAIWIGFATDPQWSHALLAEQRFAHALIEQSLLQPAQPSAAQNHCVIQPPLRFLDDIGGLGVLPEQKLGLDLPLGKTAGHQLGLGLVQGLVPFFFKRLGLLLHLGDPLMVEFIRPNRSRLGSDVTHRQPGPVLVFEEPGNEPDAVQRAGIVSHCHQEVGVHKDTPLEVISLLPAGKDRA